MRPPPFIQTDQRTGPSVDTTRIQRSNEVAGNDRSLTDCRRQPTCRWRHVWAPGSFSSDAGL